MLAYLDEEEGPNISTSCVIHVGAGRHLPFPRLLTKTKVVELALERGELRMPKVLVHDVSLEFMRVVDFDFSFKKEEKGVAGCWGRGAAARIAS